MVTMVTLNKFWVYYCLLVEFLVAMFYTFTFLAGIRQLIMLSTDIPREQNGETRVVLLTSLLPK